MAKGQRRARNLQYSVHSNKWEERWITLSEDVRVAFFILQHGLFCHKLRFLSEPLWGLPGNQGQSRGADLGWHILRGQERNTGPSGEKGGGWGTYSNGPQPL